VEWGFMGKMFFFCHPTDGVRTLKGIQSTDQWLGLVLFSIATGLLKEKGRCYLYASIGLG